MATTTTFTTMIPTPSKNTAATKRPGPPVPPRPQQSSLLRTQRDNAAAALPQRSASKVGLESAAQIHKKPTAPLAGTSGGAAANAGAGGRTVIYKSPSLTMQKRQEEREKRVGEATTTTTASVGTTPNLNSANTAAITTTTTTKSNAITQTPTTKLGNGSQAATKPPLKLRKAPDVPTSKARLQSPATETPSTTASASASQEANNIVIVQSSQGSVTLNRHHSMNTPSHSKPPVGNLKDSRLSLGRADFERVGHKINLSQLQPTTQPLPRPRKIVKIPVATLDMDDTNSNCTNHSASSASTNSHSSLTTNSSVSSSSGGSAGGLAVNLFKRSKTTLDNFTSRSSHHITTVTTGHSTGSYLSGKTVEIKNNLKNAAERLFSEIMVNQQKHGSGNSEMHGLANMVITKHERAIQHQAMGETGRERTATGAGQHNNVTVVTTSNTSQGTEEAALQINDNCTRINITTVNSAKTPSKIPASSAGGLLAPSHQLEQRQVVSAFNSPEKKSAAFHEMLISELAAMRTRSCSLENLQTKTKTQMNPQPTTQQLQLQFTSNTKTQQVSEVIQSNSNNNNSSSSNSNTSSLLQAKKMQDEEHSSNPDDDIDADNIEDADGDDGDDHHDIENVLKKSLKVMSAASQNSPRKRTPSGCSSDSSPYGTERSSRIRTSDWIEVGDNGKQVTLTSCHISLEDSGLEDEERMDEMSSSGVGDSWDSVKEAEQQQQLQQAKRSRSVKRIMSINDLPPLPKSLSGINKMLASDSGLISDVDTEMARNAKNNEFKQMENQKENSNNINNNSNNNNNTNNNKDTTSDKISNSTALSSLAATTTTTAANAANASASVTETTSTTITTTTPLKEINGNETISEIPPAIPGSKLDNQIATLRKEMFGLRQLDLTLLSQLWALNDSIQEFRTMIQENEQEDDETYSTHSRSPSPYDSVSSDGDDEISALKEIAEQTNYNCSNNSSNNKLAYSRSTSSSGDTATSYNDQKSHLIKPPLPKPLDVKPVPRMRSAPPPPPTHRKSQNAPPRPT
ncbi:rho GTPase-activating protein gacZ isoform X2 [Stomoxys calcitrans]|uniref:rho GTPase-activating protein gacZ isoform X2 n=1 Tax=Stomoxys calcitrans TaxID=35570 RepID=UPI0027E2CA72|nr:rho GTPase-activating protein gacZ isoform X2 [Stomoxys calcitrans]